MFNIGKFEIEFIELHNYMIKIMILLLKLNTIKSAKKITGK